MSQLDESDDIMLAVLLHRRVCNLDYTSLLMSFAYLRVMFCPPQVL